MRLQNRRRSLWLEGMIYAFGANGKVQILNPQRAPADLWEFVWVDCVAPTREEESMVERLLGVELPTHEEMRGAEVVNRLSEHGGIFTMATVLVAKSDSAAPETSVVTFILTPKHLITLRYHEYVAFKNFSSDFHYTSADGALVGLIENIMERSADLLDRVGVEAETVSADLFNFKMQAAGVTQPHVNTKTAAKPSNKPKRKKAKHTKPREILNRVGAIGNLDTKIRESLVSLQRLTNFLNDTRTAQFSHESRIQLQAKRADLQALCEHSYFLADKITFLLDATLGLINIEQNDIIKVFSIAAVMFMPPTLIASIYGMNFKYMNELSWDLGYEYALMLMLLSTLAPYFFFKKRGWV